MAVWKVQQFAYTFPLGFTSLYPRGREVGLAGSNSFIKCSYLNVQLTQNLGIFNINSLWESSQQTNFYIDVTL